MQCASEYSIDENNRIQNNFKRLKDIHYLDHAGTTQYADQQMHTIYSNLVSNVYCNPHTNKNTEDLIDQVRYKILNSFNTTTDEYSVIFTGGTTASLKLLAETFDFACDVSSCFSYLRDNHTSVLGMREIVNTKNINCIERDDFMHGQFSEQNQFFQSQNDSNGNSLVVFPAQCNFSGYKYPLQFIERIQTQNGTINVEKSKHYVCLDAASYVSTNYLDLNKWRPDFVCISFYKMFGYPSGLGALLVNRRGENVLHKTYYGGGTVKISFSDASGWHQKRDCIHERFEDGTIPYLSIISLLAGYETIEDFIPGQSMERISQHCFNLCKYLYESLKCLKYRNGCDVVRFYHDSNFTSKNDQGGIVNFNVLQNDGNYVGYSEVAYMAQLHNINLRTGCFCNPGACQRHLRLTNEDLRAHFKAGHICGDANDLIDGVPTGSIRISVGYMTTIENVDAVIKLIADCYCNKNRKTLTNHIDLGVQQNHELKNKTPNLHTTNPQGDDNNLVNSTNIACDLQKLEIEKEFPSNTTAAPQPSIKLREICVFPVKSCAAFRVDTNWPINRRGLKYDREWMIVRSNGVAMTQKADTKLCLIQPTIYEAENILELSFPYAESIRIPLRIDTKDNKTVSLFCQSKVCGDRIDGIDCGDEIADWLSDVLCISGLRLIQQNVNDKRVMKGDEANKQAISLSNQAQFLLINVASVDWLTQKVHNWCELDECSEKVLQNTIDRFRGNLIIESTIALEEMQWKSIQFGDVMLTVTGPCTRCQMICIDQSTGEKTTEPLQTISREFQGKMRFGIYLCQSNGEQFDNDRMISCKSVVTFRK